MGLDVNILDGVIRWDICYYLGRGVEMGRGLELLSFEKSDAVTIWDWMLSSGKGDAIFRDSLLSPMLSSWREYIIIMDSIAITGARYCYLGRGADIIWG